MAGRRMRVLVGMSGGVDSAVAAALLAADGCEVTGVTFRTRCYSEAEEEARRSVPCCSLDALEDARRVCARVGIRHHTLDVAEDFERLVVDPFCDDYAAGRTPNPCVICNREIKFGRLLALARGLGMDYVASGHYARVVHGTRGGRHRLLRGRDRRRDQSYVLWPLPQEALGMALFPLGELTKEEVRAEAAARGLPVAAKEASQEICFVSGDYRDFLRRRACERSEAVGFQPGPILDSAGRRVGTHDGIARYTLGQRKGLPALGGKPRYVVALDVAGQAVRLGNEEDLWRREILVHDLNFVGAASWAEPGAAEVQIRAHHAAARAVVSEAKTNGASQLLVRFDGAQRAPTPGQSAVIYRGDEVLAGGVISEAPDSPRSDGRAVEGGGLEN